MIGRSSSREFRTVSSNRAWDSSRCIGIKVRCVILVGALVVFGAVGPITWKAIVSIVSTSDTFQLSAIEVKGLRLLSGNEILSASGLVIGDNVFDVDLDSVANRIEALTWVKRASAHARPPDRIVVSIDERQRIAWLDVGLEPYGVDGEGIVLDAQPKLGEGVQDLDLPVIQLLSVDGRSLQVNPGDVIADSTLRVVLAWWSEAVRGDSAFCRNVSSIESFGRDAVALRLVGDDLEVRVPATTPVKSMEILKQMMSRIYEGQDIMPAYVDLRYEGQVVVGTSGQAESLSVVDYEEG